MHAVPVRFIVPCVDVVMLPKFGNCGISMRKVIVTSIS